ncbi:MAG: MazG-like family protein [Loktanella sp.]|nr:MazG-like family protein [Loktanella sp.]
MHTIQKTISLIRDWARARNIIAGGSAQAQMLKLTEEIGELAGGIAKDRQADIEDAIGDCFVLLTIIAAHRGVDIETCIGRAYNEIKDRRGRMIDGVFVKEEDLPDDPE